MPEEPDLTPREIEELVRKMEQRAARAAQAKTTGVPAGNGRTKKQRKKKAAPVRNTSSKSA
jgi:hypothetical protein